MNVQVKNTAFVIGATSACCSHLRRRAFSGLLAVCLLVGWSQALRAGEELFKPKWPELKNPNSLSEERRASLAPLLNTEPQPSLIEVYRERLRTLEAEQGRGIPKSRLRGNAVEPPLISPTRVVAPSEDTKSLVDRVFGQQDKKSKSKKFNQLCKIDKVLTYENLPHSSEFHEECEDYQLSKHKVFCLAFPQARSCADLLPILLFRSLQSDDIPN